ncbi:S9 family peptidase [Granulicella sp. WH15]|uniref:S9 family peptidase n=1 Tax=Granulicella sp. WH15 TaxID=2602070 RepID=UPI001366EC6A|nr:S9 family peptidase [Granulicella sp. WH15]QHN02794.1 S9 family peptidase [Granulicella sp. WH15]
MTLPIQPPVARRESKTTTLHGTTMQDDYAWLRDKSSAEVLAYLEAENRYTDAVMEPTRELQATLYAEMLSHIKETDESVPYPDRGFLYWTRTLEGKQYPIYCRRANAPDALEEILLDVNLLAEGQAFMAVGGMAVSPSGRLLAYTTDNTGFRQYTLHVRDLGTGADLPDTAVRVGSVAWATDSETLFYTTEDETTKRQNQLFRHTLGGASVLVFEEPDERFNIGIGLTSDRRYLMLECGSHTTNEYRFLPAAAPTAEFTLIAPRVDDQEYHPDHRDGLFYLRTNDTVEHFRLVTAPVATPGREYWQPLYESQQQLPLEDFDLFQSFLVLSERERGLPTLTVYDLADAGLENPRAIAFPEPTYTAQAHVNREFDTRLFRYGYTSLVSPASVYEYDLATGSSRLLKQQEVPGGFDSSRYASERLWVPAEDGTQIPISLVYRRDRFHKDSTNPLYVYGYGSYGYALPVGFSGSRLSLLDRGLVLAYAHIRGGGELGDPWHDAGKMSHKRNTFTDFITATEHLVQQGYGDPARVAIEGGSAGGLLMGAVVNIAAQTRRPQLFRVVLSHVPFVDVMNTMLDASLPLTVAEYEEWGNPNEPGAFAYMLSYSPYENLDALAGAPVPAMLVKTSLNDSQVMYWEPAKYVAKLRTLKQNETPLLLHINMEAGHGGASGRYDYLKEIAFDYAFLLTQLEAV